MSFLTAGRPPAWVRKMEVGILLRAFGRAFGVEVPTLRGCGAGDALALYREFSAACMELAAERDLTQVLRPRLGEQAFRLGALVRCSLTCRGRAFEVARYFYRGIGIELVAAGDGVLRFGPCSFARRYTPEDCWFMSAFDEGFLQGMLGRPDARLEFECRLSQGAPCCLAVWGKR